MLTSQKNPLAARRPLLGSVGLYGSVGLCLAVGAVSSAETVRYARFRHGTDVSYGIVEGDRVRELRGDLFGEWSPGDRVHRLADVTLLVPSVPRQVFAMAGNYRSHVAGESAAVPEKFQIPQPFLKPWSCLTAHDTDILLPRDATDVHYEAELVVVIGKPARNVDPQNALEHVLGVTCGNDVSERVWQQADVQWWRAKGSDTFGPCGPTIVSGLDYDNLQVTLRLNGEVRQHESTQQLIHDVASTVSFLSRYTTLHPGDLIFTGTSGSTSKLQPGDMVEVEIEGVGILRNRVVAEPD